MSSWKQYPLNEALASSNSRPLVPCYPLPLFSSSSLLFPFSLPITCLPGWLDCEVSLWDKKMEFPADICRICERKGLGSDGEGQREVGWGERAERTSGFLGVAVGREKGGGWWESRLDRDNMHMKYEAWLVKSKGDSDSGYLGKKCTGEKGKGADGGIL